jgi:hypothetical protein
VLRADTGRIVPGLVLPDELGVRIGELMDAGLTAIIATLEG